MKYDRSVFLMLTEEHNQQSYCIRFPKIFGRNVLPPRSGRPYMYSDTNVRWNEKDNLQCCEPEIRFTFLRDIPSETFFLGRAGKDKYRYILTKSVEVCPAKSTGEFCACSVSRRVLDCSNLPCSKCTFRRTFSRALLRFF